MKISYSLTTWITRIYRWTRRNLYETLRPKQRTLRHIKYRNADFVVLSNEDVGWRLIRDKKFEEEEINCLESYVEEDSVCIDVGANIGIYSIFLARKASKGCVHAFEPHPLNRKILQLNAELNGRNNIEIHHFLVGNHEGMIDFSISSDLAYSSMIPTKRKAETDKIRLPCTTLDALFSHSKKRIDVIKIDTEGAELLVLKGAELLLRNPAIRPRALLIEINRENQIGYGYKAEDIRDFMMQNGYEPYSIVNGHTRKGWLLPNCKEDVIFLRKT